MADSELLVLLPISSLAPGSPITNAPNAADFNGTICELQQRDDGTFTAEIRIPAFEDPDLLAET